MRKQDPPFFKYISIFYHWLMKNDISFFDGKKLKTGSSRILAPNLKEKHFGVMLKTAVKRSIGTKKIENKIRFLGIFLFPINDLI